MDSSTSSDDSSSDELQEVEDEAGIFDDDEGENAPGARGEEHETTVREEEHATVPNGIDHPLNDTEDEEAEANEDDESSTAEDDDGWKQDEAVEPKPNHPAYDTEFQGICQHARTIVKPILDFLDAKLSQNQAFDSVREDGRALTQIPPPASKKIAFVGRAGTGKKVPPTLVSNH